MTPEPAPRLLFVPVSGPFGMGEYARSLAIAQAVRSRWPSAAIEFVLSREAPYSADTPFPATLLPSSATFHSREVIRRIREFAPNVVVFDNAGRSAQLAAAHRLKARVVYISARSRQRRKAFRLRWMRRLDQHWIAYPRFIAGELHGLERLKLGLLGRPEIRFLDVILPAADPARSADVLSRAGVTAPYVLFVPGGGTGHPGAADATSVFLSAADALATEGVKTLCVGVAPDEEGSVSARGAPRALRLARLPLAQLAELMRGAAIVVGNGGSTLLQAIACGTAVVAVPIAGDQQERIRSCARIGAALEAPLHAGGMAAAVRELWADTAARAALASRAAALDLADGIHVALDGLAALLEPCASGGGC